MPLNIKDEETHALAKKLAGMTGKSMAKAVKQALQEQVERTERMRRKNRADRVTELNRIALYCASLPVLDSRSDDEILGYDSDGLPS